MMGFPYELIILVKRSPTLEWKAFSAGRSNDEWRLCWEAGYDKRFFSVGK